MTVIMMRLILMIVVIILFCSALVIIWSLSKWVRRMKEDGRTEDGGIALRSSWGWMQPKINVVSVFETWNKGGKNTFYHTSVYESPLCLQKFSQEHGDLRRLPSSIVKKIIHIFATVLESWISIHKSKITYLDGSKCKRGWWSEVYQEPP